jgi:four helix bundle protein
VNGKFIPRHGGYQCLLSYQRAEVVYDATVRFCADLLNPRDRTVDQMVQAARSGKQNIVEASLASGTSKETEIKLTNVARASLEELLIDYRDFLRTKRLVEWPREHRYVLRLRALNRTPGAKYETFRRAVENRDPEIRANAIIGLIKVTTYLVDQQIAATGKRFCGTRRIEGKHDSRSGGGERATASEGQGSHTRKPKRTDCLTSVGNRVYSC